MDHEQRVSACVFEAVSWYVSVLGLAHHGFESSGAQMGWMWQWRTACVMRCDGGHDDQQTNDACAVLG